MEKRDTELVVPVSASIATGLKGRLAQLGRIQKEIELIVATAVGCAGEDRMVVLRQVGDDTLTVQVIEEE